MPGRPPREHAPPTGRYKIKLHASGPTSTYFVYKWLGGPFWPLGCWALRPSYSCSTRDGAERWIAETEYTESPAGQKEQAEREAHAKRVYLAGKAAIIAMDRAGWTLDHCRNMFMHEMTGIEVPREHVMTEDGLNWHIPDINEMTMQREPEPYDGPEPVDETGPVIKHIELKSVINMPGPTRKPGRRVKL